MFSADRPNLENAVDRTATLRAQRRAPAADRADGGSTADASQLTMRAASAPLSRALDAGPVDLPPVTGRIGSRRHLPPAMPLTP